MSLRIFNTLNMQKEPFEPIEPGKVRMYVCGVTVYDYCHVGHARSAIVFDTIYRYLQHLGYDITYARNFTDIDDKIIKRANEENIPWTEVTKKYIDAFYEDMGKLNILIPTEEPKATDHIEEMIDMIKNLEAQGKAYASDGDVYYSIKSFDEYGKLSGRNLDDLIAGARVEVGEKKRDPLDFALWKKSKPDEPFWDSPWGQGRPGWHIECSAMSQKYLGTYFDIHGGGKDLVFPHHENEIAQSRGCSGDAFVKYWVHNGFVNINEEKMSKSLGNFFTIRDILKKYHPEVLRLFLLTNHYRGPIDFSDQYLDDAWKMLDRFYDFLSVAEEHGLELKENPLKDNMASQPLIGKFDEAMNDDFNTALALGHINDELRYLNSNIKKLSAGSGDELEARAYSFIQTVRLLGLFEHSPQQFKQDSINLKKEDRGLDVEKIKGLIEKRKSARASKDWALADECRDALTDMGVVIKDTATGTDWELK